MKLFILGLLVYYSAFVHSQSVQCKTSSDCRQDECCVEEDKRLRRFIFGTSLGFCQPKRGQGQACHVYLQHALGHPEMYLNYCPCENTLVCCGTTVDGNIHHNPICVPASVSETTTMLSKTT